MRVHSRAATASSALAAALLISGLAGCERPPSTPTTAPTTSETATGARPAGGAAPKLIEGSLSTSGARATDLPPGDLPLISDAELDKLPVLVKSRIRDAAEAYRADPSADRVVGTAGAMYWVYGHNDAAIKCFERASLISPGAFQWYYTLGLVAEGAGDKAKATEAYRKAAELEPRFPAAHIRLGLMLLEDAPDKAEAPLNEALKLNPADALAMRALSQIYRKQNRDDEAIAMLENALVRQPDYADAHRDLAKLLEKAGRADQAARHTAAAKRGVPVMIDDLVQYEMRLVGLDLPTIVRTALKDAERRKFKEAEESLLTALQLERDGYSVRRAMAMVKFYQRKPDEAISALRPLVDAHPEDLQMREQLADAYALTQKPAEAAAELRKCLEQAPDRLLTRVKLGAQLYRMKDVAAAKAELQKVIAADASFDSAYLALADIANDARDRIELERVLRQCLTNAPNSTMSLNSLAWVLATSPNQAQRNPSEAVELAQRACTLTQRRQHEFLDTLACSYAALSRFDEAQKAIIEALHLAEAIPNLEAVKTYRERLKLFRDKKPYIDPR